MHALIPDALLTELNALQQRILREGLPVLVVFEGSSGRVIGRVNSELIRCLEPRGVLYVHFDPAADASRPILDFLHKTPGRGQIGLFDRSWYSMIIEKFNEDEKKKEFKSMLDVSNDLERYLVLNGVFLIKIILKATESAIEKYGKEYGPRIPKKSFLSMDHIDPAKYREVMFDQVYEKTDTEYAPWNKILVKGINETVIETVEKIIGMVNSRLDAGPRPYDPPKIDRIYPNPRKNMGEETKCSDYDETINYLSEQLWELQMALSLSDRSLIVCFEGWDAAGKGTCIKHLCHAFNPRGYEVFQTKVPTEEEISHTYLWRFLRGIPEKGRITVFDRTWYGRMMVEHIEGFCTEEEYRRSPAEINAFEKMIVNNGAILVKFWLDITSDEQLVRFNDRANDPLKQWKITEDDWRNRSKWDEYDEHVDIMMESTNTDHAPWVVVDANNKKRARVKVLETVVEALREELMGR